MLWRPVLAKRATREEIDRHWSLKDLAMCHHFMDLEDEGADYHQKKHDAEMKKASK